MFCCCKKPNLDLEENKLSVSAPSLKYIVPNPFGFSPKKTRAFGDPDTLEDRVNEYVVKQLAIGGNKVGDHLFINKTPD